MPGCITRPATSTTIISGGAEADADDAGTVDGNNDGVVDIDPDGVDGTIEEPGGSDDDADNGMACGRAMAYGCPGISGR